MDRMAGQGITTQDLRMAQESPLAGDLALLFQRHNADMHADTPPESIHMIPREGLVSPAIIFCVARLSGLPVAMGAIKRLDDRHGELKSMHVLTEYRGRGLSRLMLHHLIAEAKAAGCSACRWRPGYSRPSSPHDSCISAKALRNAGLLPIMAPIRTAFS